MKHAILLSAVPVDAAMKRYCRPGSFVVACDAGYRNSDCLGVHLDLIVGDFDSAPQPDTDSDTIVLPHVKDDTDTHYAAKWLLENGYTQVTMLGALGGARLEHTIANLDTTSENTQSAESRIRDTDMASEMVTYSKNNILAQAGQSMLAQANQSTQGVLSLLQ